MTITKDIADLKRSHEGRSRKRQQYKALRRGYDPRLLEDVNVMTEKGLMDLRLKTNDPITYFNLATYMLSSQEIDFRIMTLANQSDMEKVNAGKTERALASIVRQNDIRLMRKGMPRLRRSLAETACEMGVSAVSVASYKRGNNVHFVIEPVDPEQIYERMDDFGLAEVLHTTRIPFKAVKEIARWYEWDLSKMPKIDDYASVVVENYYKRTFNDSGESDIYNAVRVRELFVKGTDEQAVLEPTLSEIPYFIRYHNGETFPGQAFISDRSTHRVAQSIFETNLRTYLDTSDFLKELDIHMKEVNRAPIDEFTAGGRPVADPESIDHRTGRSIQSYDSTIGDQGRRALNINQISPSIQFLASDLSGQAQRGSVPHLLHGNIQFQLSGFAISQIKKGALAALGEVAIGLEAQWADIANWILGELQSNRVKSMQVPGYVATTERREEFFEEFSSTDIPEARHVFARIDLDMPSDLTERVNLAQMLDRSGRPLLDRNTLYEELLSDIVKDPELVKQAVEEQELSGIEAVQLLTAAAAASRKASAESNPERSKAYAELARSLSQAAQSRIGTNREGTPQQMTPEALPTPMRGTPVA